MVFDGLSDVVLPASELNPEHLSIRFRADLFNLTNRPQYGAPNADFSAANFGIITTTLGNYATGRGTPRELQLSMKILF
jgi:hypothetical protein